MTSARERRNKRIGDLYLRFRKDGLSDKDAVWKIYESLENHDGWCLSEGTIRVIATFKDYGKKKNEVA
jgi:hypothetical protein